MHLWTSFNICYTNPYFGLSQLLFIGIFTVAKWWEAEEVEDFSVLILDRYCICGSKFWFEMDATNNGACTLPVFGRWLWTEATAEACIHSIPVEIWYLFSTGADERLSRPRDYSNKKRNSSNINSPLFDFLDAILRSWRYLYLCKYMVITLPAHGKTKYQDILHTLYKCFVALWPYKLLDKLPDFGNQRHRHNLVLLLLVMNLLKYPQ